jgi:transcriptional regulator with XRE-family HTH domain
VNSNTSELGQIARSLTDKGNRDAFVAQEIATTIPFQIRALRTARRLSQKKLGELAGMRQETVSLLENPDYGRVTIRTLLRLAAAFDVGLLVRFVPYSTVVDWTVASERDVVPESYGSDLQLILMQSYPKTSPPPQELERRAEAQGSGGDDLWFHLPSFEKQSDLEVLRVPYRTVERPMPKADQREFAGQQVLAESDLAGIAEQ